VNLAGGRDGQPTFNIDVLTTKLQQHTHNFSSRHLSVHPLTPSPLHLPLSCRIACHTSIRLRSSIAVCLIGSPPAYRSVYPNSCPHGRCTLAEKERLHIL
jgi:hypothetical protein